MKGHEFYPGSGRGAVRPAGCARGAVLRRIVVPLEGGYKRDERGGEAFKSLLDD
jgi:hypothetical protein